MKELHIKNQAEFDAIPNDYNGRIYIEFGMPYNRAVINRRFRNYVVARGNSSVVAWGNSSVVAMENSSVEAMENSSVVARGNSSVEARGNSSVEAMENSSVEARENSQICDRTQTHKLATSGNARIIYDPRGADEYIKFYELAASDGKVRLFKAVHKTERGYVADHGSDFIYTIGGEAVADALTEDVNEACGHGIHMAHKAWCMSYGSNWSDLAILELETDIDGLIVPLGGSGKVRAAKATVIREVPLEECGLYGKILTKRMVAHNGE